MSEKRIRNSKDLKFNVALEAFVGRSSLLKSLKSTEYTHYR